MKKITMLLVIAGLLSTTGCTRRVLKDIDAEVAKNTAYYEAIKANSKVGKPVEHTLTTVQSVDDVWIPITKLKKPEAKDPFLEMLERRQVTVNRRMLNMSESASYITTLTGISVMVDPRLLTNAQQGGSTSTGSTGGLPPAPTGAAPSNTAAYQMQTTATMQQLSYSGSLKSFLDLIASRYNAYWEKEGQGIRFFRTKAQTFRISSLPGATNMTGRVGTAGRGSSGGGAGASSGGGSGGSSNAVAEQNSGYQFAGLSVWKAIEDSVKAMLSADGKVVVSEATGTVTVDDNPVVLNRVATFIAMQNDALTRQVVLNFKVLSININNADNYGINWTALGRSLGGVSLSFASGFADSTKNAGGTLTLKRLNGSFANSQAVLKALSEQGRVTQLTSGSLMTVNNQPVPINVGTQDTYIARTTTTLAGPTGSTPQISVEPGVVNTGFSMSMLPHILDNNKIMLQYSGELSSLVGGEVEYRGPAGNEIGIPSINTRNFLQRVILDSGEMLVLTGFEQMDAQGSQEGIGSAENVALGGSVSGSRNKDILVMLLQPVLMDK